MPEPITISVTRHVVPERSREVAAWARSGQDLIATFPGFLGSGWVRSEVDGPEWHMLFRFADVQSLTAWEQSDERAWWVASANGIVAEERQERRTGIEGWFDEPATVEVIRQAAPAPAPPRWKQAVTIFVGFFPINLLAQFLLGPFIGHWPLEWRVLLTVVILTPLMTYFVLPAVTRALHPWLIRPPK